MCVRAFVLSDRNESQVMVAVPTLHDGDGPGDADVGMVDVVLSVVCPQELLVLVHAEGYDLVDAL